MIKREHGWVVVSDGDKIITAHVKYRSRWPWLKYVAWIFGYPQVWFTLDRKPFQKKRVLESSITTLEPMGSHDVEVWCRQPWFCPWVLESAGCSGYPQVNFGRRDGVGDNG